MDELRAQGRREKLLLHVCCAPCASYCLEYLTQCFDVTVYFYNPNITDESEYRLRLDTLYRLLEARGDDLPCIDGGYDPGAFMHAVRGFEDAPEGGARCDICFALRLDATARYAAEHGFDCFTTSLSISPHKDAEALYRIATAAAEKYGIRTLPVDFKKHGGYQISCVLSRELGLYRQNFCGCEFSRRQE